MTKSPIMISSRRCSGLECYMGRFFGFVRRAGWLGGSGAGFVDGKTYLPCTRFVSSAAIRGSISTAVQCFALFNISTVRFPVPGPTSRTLSVGRRFAWLTKQNSNHASREKTLDENQPSPQY